MNKRIDSIVSQGFSDFECILVDDGSTDGNGLICNAYAPKMAASDFSQRKWR